MADCSNKTIKNYIMNTQKTVLDTLKKAAKPLKAGEIIELSGLKKAEVDSAMKTLKESGDIVSPKRCYWEPKK